MYLDNSQFKVFIRIILKGKVCCFPSLSLFYHTENMTLDTVCFWSYFLFDEVFVS